MIFNIVTFEKGLSAVREEFPHDNILIFDYNLFNGFLDNSLSIKNNDLFYKLLKLLLMKKYKNLIFIDYPNVVPLKGLRQEIIELSKSKDNFFYLNEKLDIFYSKKCIKLIKNIINQFQNIKDVSMLENLSFFMKNETRQNEFTNIKFYDGLKLYMGLFQEKENIFLLDLKKQPFNPDYYKKYIKDDSSFLICYNAENYEPGWNYDKTIKNLVIIDFDVQYLPIRYDEIKTYINVNTNKKYQGYFSNIKNIKGLL